MMLRSIPLMACLAAGSLVAAAGCHEAAGPRSVANPNPAVKIPAIKEAVAEQDKAEVAAMVKSLESDDPAVRLFAIEGLQRLTGKTHGYHYFADQERRAAAVARWKRWLEEQSAR